MEFFLFLIAVAALWYLAKGFDEPANDHETRREDPVQRAPRSQIPPDPQLQAWEASRDQMTSEMPERRAKVLAAARAGRLSRKQLATIVETSTQFGFSGAELQELERLRGLQARHVDSQATCRICGSRALPGEDLCYTHHTD